MTVSAPSRQNSLDDHFSELDAVVRVSGYSYSILANYCLYYFGAAYTHGQRNLEFVCLAPAEVLVKQQARRESGRSTNGHLLFTLPPGLKIIAEEY